MKKKLLLFSVVFFLFFSQLITAQKIIDKGISINQNILNSKPTSYRITINGFTCNKQTWDDALNRDGWGIKFFL